VDAYHRIVSATPGGALGLLIIIAVLALILVLLVRRRGASGRLQRRGHTGLELPPDRSADDLRAEADALAGRGEWAAAVRARLRAVIRALEERGVLDPRPGRTAAEVAAEAGSARPDLREQLWSGALTFGEIWYGGRRATADDDRILADLDAAVRSRRPSARVPAGAAPAPPPR
jgi:hypothetical protein